MTQHPASPEQPEQEHGTFLGGEFGTSDNAEDKQTTAQQIEAERATHPAGPLAAPAAAEEFVTEPSGTDTFDGDVEGTSTEATPGERNEPV